MWPTVVHEVADTVDAACRRSVRRGATRRGEAWWPAAGPEPGGLAKAAAGGGAGARAAGPEPGVLAKAPAAAAPETDRTSADGSPTATASRMRRVSRITGLRSDSANEGQVAWRWPRRGRLNIRLGRKTPTSD